MVLVYGLAASKGRAVRRIYHERFQHCLTPPRTLFAKIIQLLRESGTFTDNRIDWGAPRRRRKSNFEEDVLHRVEVTPSMSTRTIARGMGVPHSTVREVLHEQQLCPYHPQRVHWMGPADCALCANSCTWFLHCCVEEPQFPRQILFTEECRFARDAVFNSWNSHILDDEKPQAQYPPSPNSILFATKPTWYDVDLSPLSLRNRPSQAIFIYIHHQCFLPKGTSFTASGET